MQQCLEEVDCTHAEIKQPDTNSENYLDKHMYRLLVLTGKLLCVLIKNDLCMMCSPVCLQIWLHERWDNLLRGVVLQSEDAVPMILLGIMPCLMKQYANGSINTQEHIGLSHVKNSDSCSFWGLKARNLESTSLLYFWLLLYVLHKFCVTKNTMPEQNVTAAMQYDRESSRPLSLTTSEHSATKQRWEKSEMYSSNFLILNWPLISLEFT